MNTGRKVGAFEAPNYDYRLDHVGLSNDGRHCFMASDSNSDEYLWDIAQEEFIWDETYSGENALLRPDLAEWIEDGYYAPLCDPLQGRYRIIGMFEDHPLLENQRHGLRITAIRSTTDDYVPASLELRDLVTDALVQRLEFKYRSGDFASATFSADGSMLAAATPWDVTFFAPQDDLED